MEPNSELLRSLRHSYERGRAIHGAWTALLCVPLVCLSFGGCCAPFTSIRIGAVLIALVGVFAWRGGPVGRAVIPGLVAGAVSLAFPLLATRAIESLGLGRGLSLAACAAGGIVGGIVVARKAARLADQRVPFLVAGGLVATLCGALGCMNAGVTGCFIMLLSLVVTSPIALRAPVRPV